MSEQRHAGISRRNFAKASAVAAARHPQRAIRGRRNHSGTPAGLIGAAHDGRGDQLPRRQRERRLSPWRISSRTTSRALADKGHGKPEISKCDVAPTCLFARSTPPRRSSRPTSTSSFTHHALLPPGTDRVVAAASTSSPRSPSPWTRSASAGSSPPPKGRGDEALHVTGTQRPTSSPGVDNSSRRSNGAVGEIVAARPMERHPALQRRASPNGPTWKTACATGTPTAGSGGDNIVEQHVHNLDIINWSWADRPPRSLPCYRAWKQTEPNPEATATSGTASPATTNTPTACMLSMSRHWPHGSASNVSEFVVGTKGGTCRDMGEEGRDPYVQEHIQPVAAIRGEAPTSTKASSAPKAP